MDEEVDDCGEGEEVERILILQKKSSLFHANKLAEGFAKIDEHIDNIECIGADLEVQLNSMHKDLQKALKKCKELEMQSSASTERAVQAGNGLKIKESWTQTQQKHSYNEEEENEEFYYNIFFEEKSQS